MGSTKKNKRPGDENVAKVQQNETRMSSTALKSANFVRWFSLALTKAYLAEELIRKAFQTRFILL